MFRWALDVLVRHESALLTRIGPVAQARFLEFFTVRIRNPNTRKAYYRAATDFMEFARLRGASSFDRVSPTLVAAWVEDLGRRLSSASVKQYLAGLSMLF